MNGLIRFAMVAFFPRVEPLPGVEDLDLDAQIAKFRADSTLLLWVGAVAGAVLFQVSPIATVRRPVLASWLSAEDLDRHAFRLGSHPVYLVRQAMFLLKMMGGIFWGQSDAVRASIALPPYDRDPGTRRMDRHVAASTPTPRAPRPELIALGQKERDRGRIPGPGHP